MKKIEVTEGEIRQLVRESVMRLLEFDEMGYYGFDEKSSEGVDDNTPKGSGNSGDSDMRRKRDTVDRMFSNEDGKSDIKRRGAIELLYHPKDKGEWDTYRSMFSKYLDPEDTAHVWDDSEINKLYNWLSNRF